MTIGSGMDGQEYCIISDDDGHKYVCPVDRLEEALIMFEAIYDYEREDRQFPCKSPYPPEPDFITRINGHIALVKFKDWRIE